MERPSSGPRRPPPRRRHRSARRAGRGAPAVVQRHGVHVGRVAANDERLRGGRQEHELRRKAGRREDVHARDGRLARGARGVRAAGHEARDARDERRDQDLHRGGRGARGGHRREVRGGVRAAGVREVRDEGGVSREESRGGRERVGRHPEGGEGVGGGRVAPRDERVLE
eukprot:31468-Pelagococcus_subviridis.AAC.4